jgi:hypothetical protein
MIDGARGFTRGGVVVGWIRESLLSNAVTLHTTVPGDTCRHDDDKRVLVRQFLMRVLAH